MTSADLPDGPGQTGVEHRGRRVIAILTVGAIACLAVAIAAGAMAHAELVRKPTGEQRSAAAAAAMADRWHIWPAGRIFPAMLSYGTDLLTTETASRIGISPEAGCASAIDASLLRLAVADRCRAGLRATYLDQLQGIVYTVGVLAFPDAHLAAAFSARLPHGATAAIPLRALALPGTASALFSADARQAATARQEGPFVVLTAAGYADGEPTGADQEAHPAIFAPAAQLAAAIIAPLTQPVTVNCHSPEWSC
jgi:hypothetical protein